MHIGQSPSTLQVVDHVFRSQKDWAKKTTSKARCPSDLEVFLKFHT